MMENFAIPQLYSVAVAGQATLIQNCQCFFFRCDVLKFRRLNMIIHTSSTCFLLHTDISPRSCYDLTTTRAAVSISVSMCTPASECGRLTWTTILHDAANWAMNNHTNSTTVVCSHRNCCEKFLREAFKSWEDTQIQKQKYQK